MMIYDWTRIQAERNPERIALSLSNHHMSYGELESASNRLAGMLLLSGLKPAYRVGLFTGKTLESVVALMGISKAGGVSLPFDPSAGEEYLAHLFRSVQIDLLMVDHTTFPTFRKLTSNHGRFSRIPWVWCSSRPEPYHPVAPSFSLAEAASQPDLPYQKVRNEDLPAQMFFVSGPSENPRAMELTHREIRTFMEWAVSYFGIRPGDRISGYFPLHTEPSLFDLYGTLAAGAHLYLAGRDAVITPHQLAAYILENDLTQWFSPPTVLGQIARHDAIPSGGFPGLERVIWSGKMLSGPSLRYWMQRVPDGSFSNLFGPNENTLSGRYYLAPQQAAAPGRHRKEAVRPDSLPAFTTETLEP